ncbi:hypothetical protein [Streptomyces sp. S.PNR 29]|uniref:hypothetical protein n=1 Tax=Streptomyces sp. S.PNR 29 TaxID=2973805 RepID=UPI0025B1F480|nr:hypothetical protein [Streptomyces sp. S.PNR 29]MDN0201220.1 hypothetical protein [Streptomyces sp. S.PNR 29]
MASTSASAGDEGWEDAGWYSADAAFPSGTICVPGDSVGNQACFRKNGDQWFVYDGEADLLSPYVNWQNRLSYDNGSTWQSIPYRSGKCRNSWPNGNWGVCNKDFYESSSLNKIGGHGSQVRFQLCLTSGFDGNGCYAWSNWIDNNG